MRKVTVYLIRDEWYPVYDWNTVPPSGFEVKINPQTLARYKRVFGQFKKVQRELEKEFKTALDLTFKTKSNLCQSH